MAGSGIKRAALGGLHKSGIISLITRRHKNDLLVLGYHGIVSEPKEQPFRYHHTLAEFRSQLEWLGQNFTPIGLNELPRWWAGDWRPPKPPVLITFDDGYRNNVTNAAPELKQAGMPAVFFLATSYIGSDRILWTDEVFLRVANWPNGALMDLAGEPVARAAASRIVEDCKRFPDAKRREYLEYLRQKTADLNLKIDAEAQEFMSWEQARGLAAAGFEIGSHTDTHPILSRISTEQAKQELARSREIIRRETGAPCNAIAYPNGRAADFSQEVIAAAKEAGYEHAFVVSGKWASRMDPFRIDRIIPPVRADLATFAFHISGARDKLKRVLQ